jgi:fructoselysine 6-kinase
MSDRRGERYYGGAMKILTLARFCVDVFPEQGSVYAGGNALNVAVSCAKTKQADVFLMGNIGTDNYGNKIAEIADKHSLNREHLYRINGETASNKIHISADGERNFVPNAWNEGVLADFEISAQDKAFIKTMSAVATTVLDKPLEDLLAIRAESDFMLAVDFMDDKQCEFSENWRDYLPNLDLFFISGTAKTVPILKQWSLEFPAVVFAATLGENGSVAFHNGAQYACEAVKFEKIVDTTGCGDSYQGAFIVDYLHNRDVESAMKAGTGSAAVTLGFVGAV